MQAEREVRRILGLIHRYVPDALLKMVGDPRKAQGKRWDARVLLKSVLVGMMAGCKGLLEVEEMTVDLSPSMRKLLGIKRRVPDTTMREYLCALVPEQIGQLISIIGYDAARRKALRPLKGFPFGVLSLDGKYPSVRDTEPGEFLQVHHNEAGRATHGLIRIITATLVSAIGRPILGACPVPAETNEQGGFQKSFGELVRSYGRLFRLVMYDAGAASSENADAVLKAGKHYFFQIADPRWIMFQTIEMLMNGKHAIVRDEQSISSRKRIVRELTVLNVTPTHGNVTIWSHVRTAHRICSETYENDVLKSSDTRYYVSSMDSVELSANKWLELIVLRWGVETCHQILDTAFQEDDHPWITKDANGALVLMLLRRIAYTIMTLYKSVSLRSDNNREMPWRKLLGMIRDALKWPNPFDSDTFRPRKFSVPPAFVD